MSAITMPAWLLRTFGSGPAVDALLGDLHEEYQDGRSAAWFWRQALTGVAVTFVADVRAHKLLTLRAVALAWMIKLTLVVIAINWRPWHPAPPTVYLPWATLIVTICAAWATGVIVTHWHRQQATSSLLTIAITYVLRLGPTWTVTHPSGERLAVDGGWLGLLPLASITLGVVFLFLGGRRGAHGEGHTLARG